MTSAVDAIPRAVPASALDRVLAQGQVRSAFQPIVELDGREIVGYEALARGPVGDLHTPDRLFAEARRSGRLAELDALCRRSALTGAIATGIAAPLTLFVNVEPEVLEVSQLGEVLDLARDAAGLEVVLEITERALSVRPSELLATVEELRLHGGKIALDDVGADDLSLAFMALLRPEVVKLDIGLVQRRPSPDIARIMNAVNAYAERTGAVLLAEGLETEEHVRVALALGATLGQGWLFGRPAATVAVGPATAIELALPSPVRGADVSPFRCLPDGTGLRRSAKPLLIEISKHLEREAALQGSSCILLAAFQEAPHFAPPTAGRYRRLAETIAFVAAVGEGIPLEPVAGVRGGHLDPTDPMRGEWDVVVLGPHFAAALLARDMGDDVADLDRRFEFALTYDRDVVVSAAHSLMSRVVAQPTEG